MANDESIPEGMKRLLDLFATDLAKVKFGDLDAAVLEGAAGVVRVAARDLAEAEALAEAARASLEAAREALVNKGQRALAYARIFAEALPDLAERLDGITIAGAARRAEPKLLTPDQAEAAPRRRGRPPRAAAPSTGTLALGGAASPHANGAAASPAEAEAAGA